MGSENGNGRILSLDDKRATRTLKPNDFITVQQAYDMVIQECAKVHEHYLTQMPTFVARMIQDALMSYGLIKLSDEASGTLEASPTSEPAVSDGQSSGDPSAARTETGVESDGGRAA